MLSVFSITPSFSYLVCKYFNLERGGGGWEKLFSFYFCFFIQNCFKSDHFHFFYFFDILQVLKLRFTTNIKIEKSNYNNNNKKNEIDARIILQVDHFVYFVFFLHILNLNIQMGIRRKTKNKALAFFFHFSFWRTASFYLNCIKINYNYIL